MIDQLKKEYLEWAQTKIKLDEKDDFVEITTPFVDMNHDYISLFFIKQAEDFKLTDDGYIIDELDSIGIEIEKSEKRNQFFHTTLKIFGVHYNNKTSELYVTFKNINEHPDVQQRLIRCLIRVSDMLLTSRNRVISFFTEDITEFFLEHDVFYNDSVNYVGRSGRNQIFDFVLPRSKKLTPKLIKAVNNPTSDAYRDPLLAFLDVQETKSDHRFIVLANDMNSQLSEKFAESLENYNIDVLPWSKRKSWVDDIKYG